MQKSTILNKEHVGLQKLSVLAEISRSSLGPWKSFKFVHDDTSGESALVSSSYRILENLELSCPVSQLVHETLQAHQKVYHTGSGCLLFLTGEWSRAALLCLQKGIPATHIISAMSEGIDICTDIFKKSTVSMEAVSDSFPAAFEDLRVQPPEKPTIVSRQQKVKLSRHFCEIDSGSVSKVTQTFGLKLHDLMAIAWGLSHGCDDLMKLVTQTIQMQSEAAQKDPNHRMFDVTDVVTCLLPGIPEHFTCVVQGCVVLLSAEQALVAHRLKEKNLQVALLNGDLADDFRHLGFHSLTGIQHVNDCLSGSSSEDRWMARVGSLLLSLEVNLILISGFACESMIDFCWRHQILLVEKLKTSTLMKFANLSGAVAVTYATQLTAQCVGSYVKVRVWRDLSGCHRKPAAAVNICPDRNSGLVTVILTSCVHGKLQAMEDRFWACAYRLHYGLKDRMLLPGAGRTEMLCIHHLLKEVDSEQQASRQGIDGQHRSVVFQLMAEGLMNYLLSIMVNSGRFTKVKARCLVSQQLQNCNRQQSSTPRFSQLLLEGEREEMMKPKELLSVQIYDNLSVKQSAWRKALDVIFLVLQSDAEIITGRGQHTDAEEEQLTLL